MNFYSVILDLTRNLKRLYIGNLSFLLCYFRIYKGYLRPSNTQEVTAFGGGLVVVLKNVAKEFQTVLHSYANQIYVSVGSLNSIVPSYDMIHQIRVHSHCF